MNNFSEKNICADNVRRCFFIVALSWSLLIFSLLLFGLWQKVPATHSLAMTVNQPHFWRWVAGLGVVWAIVLFFLGIGIRNLAATVRTLRRMRLDISRQAKDAQFLEAQFKTLFSSLPEAAFFADSRNRIIAANPAFTALTGYQPDEVRKKTTLSLFEQPGAILNNQGEVQPGSFEMECRRKDGSPIPVQVSCIRIPVELTADLRYLVLLQNISGRKTAQREREKLESRLRQAGRMEAIGTLAGGIAHDFNNILGIIFINTDIALEDIPADSSARLNLRRIVSASERGRDLVKQILAYCRQVDREPISLMPGALIKESLKFLRATAPAGIFIEEHVNDGFRSILINPANLQELMINLFSHATQVLGDRGIIEVDATVVDLNGKGRPEGDTVPPGQYFRISVNHIPPGLALDTQGRTGMHWDEKDDAGAGATPEFEAISRIVGSQGGHIVLEGESGPDSAVRIYFPLVSIEVDLDASEEGELGSERILLVDDEQMFVEMASIFLERRGFTVTVCSNGKEALATFKTSPDAFDIIITDQTMPEMTGIEFATELLRVRPEMPVILLSGYGKHISGEEVRKHGIREFLFKPFGGKMLARTIRKVMDSSQ